MTLKKTPQLFTYDHLSHLYDHIPYFASISYSFNQIVSSSIDHLVSQVQSSFESHPDLLAPTPSFLGTSYLNTSGLGLFRSLLGRGCLNNRISSLSRISSEQLEFYNSGLVILDDFLDNHIYLQLIDTIRCCLQPHYLQNNSVNYIDNSRLTGSTYIRISDSFNLVNSISSLIQHLLCLSIPYNTGIQLVSHRHYENDNDTLLHLDNAGISTLKWFYFPFGTHPLDNGFIFYPYSHRFPDVKLSYIHRWLTTKLSSTSSSISHSSFRFSQRTGLDDLTYSKQDSPYIDFIRSLKPISINKPNTLVLVDTSGFHCRSLCQPGIRRLTLQGGIDNTRCYSFFA